MERQPGSYPETGFEEIRARTDFSNSCTSSNWASGQQLYILLVRGKLHAKPLARRFRSRLRERKEKDRGCARVFVDPEAGWASGHHPNVLLAVNFIGNDPATDGAAGVEAVEDVTGLGI